MLQINCEIDLLLTWSTNYVLCKEDSATTFVINDTKIYVPVVTLSTQDNVKLLKQLRVRFNRKINWNKYQSKVKRWAHNQYLNYLFGPNFQGVNRFFVLSYENETDASGHTGYYIPKVETKDYHVMIDWRNLLNQPVNLLKMT